MELYTQKCVGALMGTFVGDALGMPVEGQSAERIEEQYGRVDEMIEARRGTGTYTDDTQMMIATARSLIRSEGVDRRDLAERYLNFYDPSRGYGEGTTQVFQLWQAGESIDRAAKQVFDGGSYGNGGAMRIAPVGVLLNNSVGDLEQAVRDVTGLTHVHPLGVGGAFIQARTVAEAMQTDPPGDSIYPSTLNRTQAVTLLRTVEDDLPKDLNPEGFWDYKFDRTVELLRAHDNPPAPGIVARELGCSSTAGQSVLTAVFASLVRMDSFSEAVSYAVSIGGDTDTIGAMAGAVSGALYGVGHVPDRWWERLEQGENGRDTVVELGEQLASRSRTESVS